MVMIVQCLPLFENVWERPTDIGIFSLYSHSSGVKGVENLASISASASISATHSHPFQF